MSFLVAGIFFYLKPCGVSWLEARYKSRNLNLTAKTIELYKDVEWEELLEKDIAFKQKFYYAKSAHYETATLGSIMLVPGERIHKALKEDYQAMHNMIYGKMPEYEEIIGYLCKLEEEVHELE